MSVQAIQLTPETAQAAREEAKASASAPSTQPAAPAKEAQTPPARPEGVPEKFWKNGAVDTEALLKSYTELEKSRTQVKPAETTKPVEGEKPADAPPPQDEQGKATESQKPAESTKAVLNQEAYSKFQAEVDAKGALSEESYKELSEKFGIDKSLVDAHVAAVRAQNDQNTAKLKSLAGGEEGYGRMISWAKDALSPAEVQAYDKAVTSGDEAAVSVAVQGLYARFTQAEGREPGRVLGGSGAPAVQPFASSKQLSDAIRDPRYATDSGYRAEVAKRLAVSSVL